MGGVPPADDAAEAPDAGVKGPAGVLYGVPGKCEVDDDDEY